MRTGEEDSFSLLEKNGSQYAPIPWGEFPSTSTPKLYRNIHIKKEFTSATEFIVTGLVLYQLYIYL